LSKKFQITVSEFESVEGRIEETVKSTDLLTNNAKEALEGFTKSYQTRRP
jgi:hypothetical protein